MILKFRFLSIFLFFSLLNGFALSDETKDSAFQKDQERMKKQQERLIAPWREYLQIEKRNLNLLRSLIKAEFGESVGIVLSLDTVCDPKLDVSLKNEPDLDNLKLFRTQKPKIESISKWTILWDSADEKLEAYEVNIPEFKGETRIYPFLLKVCADHKLPLGFDYKTTSSKTHQIDWPGGSFIELLSYISEIGGMKGWIFIPTCEKVGDEYIQVMFRGKPRGRIVFRYLGHSRGGLFPSESVE